MTPDTIALAHPAAVTWSGHGVPPTTHTTTTSASANRIACACWTTMTCVAEYEVISQRGVMTVYVGEETTPATVSAMPIRLAVPADWPMTRTRTASATNER